MSDFLRYSLMRITPTQEEIAERIRDCRAVLGNNVNGAPLCQGEALDTAEDFAARYAACMECHQAVSNARGLVGHADSDLKRAFAHIDGVLDGCTATLGANVDEVPPPASEKT